MANGDLYHKITAIISCQQCYEARGEISRDNCQYEQTAEQLKKLTDSLLLVESNKARQTVLAQLPYLGNEGIEALKLCKSCRFTSAVVANRFHWGEDEGNTEE